MGVFAEFLGIRPWEIDQLTLPEFKALCKYLDDKNKDQQ